MSGNKYIPPWKEGVLACWNICGMNHYHINGGKRLFVSMTRRDKCIVEEGEDNVELWNQLIKKAEEIDK